eukprot:GDKI01027584.1.p1 GENE.GDKI01027584.1~~GDKI01027584.1.p1  ORF type:complete len:427 (-),score=62.35 GDKI01027584.1:300-1580(-)
MLVAARSGRHALYSLHNASTSSSSGMEAAAALASKGQKRNATTFAGASRFRWTFQKPYIQRSKSLYHYPDVSKVTGEKVDWLYGAPKSGYEAVAIYGPNTIELKGMPMGRTPEYMQERLRRFFSKFGPVVHCRCTPHALDPYQCEGTAYITFRTKRASLVALKAPLKFPGSLHYKIVRMRHLDTDKENDWQYIYKAEHWNKQIVSICKQLYTQLGPPLPPPGFSIETAIPVSGNAVSTSPAHPVARSLDKVWEGLYEHEYGIGRKRTADLSVYKRLGSWDALLTTSPFDQLFHVSGDTNTPPGERYVRRKLLSSEQLDRVLIRCHNVLKKKLAEELSVHWREGKIQLPEWVQKRVSAWQHKEVLPHEVQIMSRTKDVYKIHDERLLFKLKLQKERNKKKAEWKTQQMAAKMAADTARREALESKRA